MDFGEFELEESQDTQVTQTLSLGDLQKIYGKGRKKRSELEEISRYNTQSSKQPADERQSSQNREACQACSLLDEKKITFKTVGKQYAISSCLAHLACIVLLVSLECRLWVKAATTSLQAAHLLLAAVHFVNGSCGVKLSRSRYIVGQIVIIGLADLALSLSLLLSFELAVPQLAILLAILADVVLVCKLMGLLWFQKKVDGAGAGAEETGVHDMYEDSLN